MISGCLFQKGTALLHSSFQRVRGHFNFLGGGWEQTCIVSAPYVFLPLPFLLQYKISASYLRLAIQRHKTPICGMISTHLLLLSEEARTRSSSLEKMGYKGERRTNSPALKGLEKVVPALVDLSLASHCNNPSFHNPLLTTDWRRSKHHQAMSLCFESKRRNLCPHGSPNQTCC